MRFGYLLHNGGLGCPITLWLMSGVYLGRGQERLRISGGWGYPCDITVALQLGHFRPAC